MNRARSLLLFLAAAILFGCGSEDAPPGVIATVNGKPILLGNVEFRYDLKHLDGGEAENPTVDRMRAEYGEIATDLIVQELIFQELTKAGEEVTDAEMREAEDKVRSDYPGETFEQMLIEENIDLDRWKQSVRARLAELKFSDRILKQKIKLSVQDAADYYKEHKADFNQPEKITFLLIQGSDADKTRAALERLKASPESLAASGTQKFDDGTTAQKISLRPENLPPAWSKILKDLSPGDVSALLSSKTGSEGLLLLQRNTARTLDAAQAYPLVEQRLMRIKLRQAFNDWLKEAVSKASILVSSRLLPTQGSSNDVAQGAPLMDDFGKRLPLEASGPDSPAADELVRKTVAERLREEGDSSPELQEAAAHEGNEDVSAQEKMNPAASQPETNEPAQDIKTPSEAALKKEQPVQAAPPAGDEAPLTKDASSPESAAANSPQAPQTAPVAQTDPQAAPASPPADVPPQVAPKDPDSEKSQDEGAAPQARQEPGEVVFTANKASWLILTTEEGKEERIYLKGGKTLKVPFKKFLKARFGSPSDITYDYNGRQTQVISSTKEVKTTEFPQ